VSHGCAQGLQCLAVGSFARHVHVADARQRAGVQEIQFDIIEAPGADLSHERPQPIQHIRMSGVERVELFAPIEPGGNEFPIRITQQPVGVLAE
jgi:hypothetical protein